MPMWEFAVLGPLEVSRSGQRLRISAAKQRALLACLLTRANHPVPMDELVDRVWAGSPPAEPRSTLHVYVNRLRRGLGDDLPLTTRPGTYLLTVADDQLDLLRLRRLGAAARVAAAQGDPRAEWDALEAALALWRGPVLADVSSPVLHTEFVLPLEEERLRLLERRVDVLLALGRVDEALPELAALTRRHPLRERFWARWMQALSTAGRQAEALAAYRAVERTLALELGVEPGPELRSLHAEILSGAGPGPAAARPLRPAAPRQLPPPDRVFVGRATELAGLAAGLAAPAADRAEPLAVLVTGPAGSGKTALAVRAARAAAAAYPDGQLFADLRGGSPGPRPAVAAVLARFVAALGVPPDAVPLDLDGLAAAYRSATAELRLLVVVDDTADADAVRLLLPSAPASALVATSRDELPELSISPGVRRVPVADLETDDRVRLLAECAGPDRPPGPAAALRELADACGGRPRTLRAAAAQLARHPGLAVADLTRRTAELPVRPPPGPTGADLTYAALPPAERRTLGLLAGLPVDRVTVGVAAAATGTDAADARARLDGLVARGLLREVEPDRWELDGLVRLLAGPGSEPEPAATVRVHEHYVAAAGTATAPDGAGWRFPSRSAAYDWLDGERAAILGLLRHADRTGVPADPWRLVVAASGWYAARARWTEWLTGLDIGLAAARRADADAAIATLLGLRGTLHLLRGDGERAETDLRRSLELHRRLGSPAPAGTRVALGTVTLDAGDPAGAAAVFRAAAGAPGPVGILGDGATGTALALWEAGELRPAWSALDGGGAGAGAAVVAGLVARDLGRPELAVDRFTAGIAAAADADDDRWQALGRAGLAGVHLARGEHDRALAEAEQAVDRSVRFGDRVQLDCQLVLSEALRRTGRPAAAGRGFRRTLALCRHRGTHHRAGAAALLGLAELRLAAGDPAGAVRPAETARAVLAERGLRLLAVRAGVVLARAHRADGRPDRARVRAAEARASAQACAYPLGEADACQELAELAHRAGDPLAALGFWRAAEPLYAGAGSTDATPVRHRAEALEKQLRRAG